MTPFEVGDLPLHFIVAGDPIPRNVRDCRHRAKALALLYPDVPSRIWQSAPLHRHIHDSFGEEVAAAFDELSSSGEAEALASWCLLYMFGGTFHAPGLQILTPMSVPEGVGIAAFNDVAHPCNWTAIDGMILWSRPGREEWALAINLKVEAWRKVPSRPPPDPVILGRAFGLAAGARGGRAADDQWVGQVQVIPSTNGAKARMFVSPAGTIIALQEDV